MNPPVSAREALLLEALGEISDALDRVEAIIPALAAAERRAVQAHEKLGAQVLTLEAHVVAKGEAVKDRALKYIAERTAQATRHSIDTHVQAMEKAARGVFQNEIGPMLQGLVQPLLRVQEVVRQNARPWDAWFTHAATASATAFATWLMTSGVWKP